MNLIPTSKFMRLVAIVALTLAANSAFACAVCGGASDSNLAQGMNWGIFTLLVVVVAVLGGIGMFFIFLAKRAAAVSAETNLSSLAEVNQKA